MTGRGALNDAARMLADAGVEGGDRIARLLLEEALGVTTAGLINALGREFPEPALGKFQAAVARASVGEPVQYILGHWDFYGRTFKTDPRALIPRPETELLAEAVLKEMPQGVEPQVMDAGCGTGCIGITLKLERPQAQVTLCDVSPGALSLSAQNAKLHNADVTLVNADMRLPFPGGPYDIIVSNPPYINSADMETLSPTVRDHEPRLALFGGIDGLDLIRALADRAADSLKSGGRLFIEVGYDQAEKILKLMEDSGLLGVALSDYSGILRIISVRKV